MPPYGFSERLYRSYAVDPVGLPQRTTQEMRLPLWGRFITGWHFALRAGCRPIEIGLFGRFAPRVGLRRRAGRRRL